MSEIRIGTSGYHHRHWVGRYYPQDVKPGKMLEHYVRDFDTVELNNTFYALPKEETFDNWRRSTPLPPSRQLRLRRCRRQGDISQGFVSSGCVVNVTAPLSGGRRLTGVDQSAARPASVVDFPLRRICVLGLSPHSLAVLEQNLRHVHVSTDAEALLSCDLLVIDRSAEGVRDVIRWVHASAPEFPVILCTSSSDPAAMAEAIRTMLFEDRTGWLRTQNAGVVRLEMLEAATIGLVGGRRSRCILADARDDARHLGAAFERYGLSSAATLAAEAEQLLSTPFADTRRLATIVVALRNELGLRIAAGA